MDELRADAERSRALKDRVIRAFMTTLQRKRAEALAGGDITHLARYVEWMIRLNTDFSAINLLANETADYLQQLKHNLQTGPADNRARIIEDARHAIQGQNHALLLLLAQLDPPAGARAAPRRGVASKKQRTPRRK